MTATTTPDYPSIDAADLPYLPVADPSFSVQSAAVREARDAGWCARTPYGLAILRYEQVNKLLKDRRLRQGSWAWPQHNGVEGPFAHWWAGWLLNKEGQDHARLRRLLNPAFSPKLLAALSPRFVALANELIDGFAPAGQCDFVSDFAEPYAARVIAIMLGIPEQEWPKIAEDSATLGLALGVTFKQELPRIEAALESLFAYAEQLIADRQAHPKDDFVTRLVQAQRDDDRMTHQELLDSLALLIFGGFDTTRNQLGLAIKTFLDHPDQWKLLAEHPELGGTAVEEVMRVNPAVTWVTREALDDFEFQGLAIKAGTTVHLFSESAGTDPRTVENPQFDITATGRPPHFGFGGGAHHCLGHFVARSDMSVALPILARRMPDLRLGGEADWMPLSGNTGANSLPLAFSAGH
ncbi:MAG: cytochrome P450 [Actinobacteria bacterium]|jgi:cytochrome P450|nr:cytochrome P450 [Actinomycetota bacterium]MCO5298666.1 cytochrome P450 [Candidatus Nanopelagicales bacterium]HPJ20090.1 cytochrome P450 [Actinomycetota bacterium]HRV66860.1 cytochrome P450 [Candidatus Nanopelagicales bacterium]